MSGFVKALESYLSGALSRDELFREVDRLLGHEADPSTLLASLYDEHARARLPGTLHGELVHKLLRHSAGPDLSRARARTGLAVLPVRPDDDAATIVSDDTSFDAEGMVAALPASPHKPDIAVGSVLKRRFRLVELIGEGGMSAVYKAIDLRRVEARAASTYVAVKLLTVPVGDFTRSLEVLQGEAHKLQMLPHPNIVRVIDCDRHGRTVFMTMEYLTGESLKRRMNAPDFKGMPQKEATRIVDAIASGLAFAHRNGIIHGDLKPGNVLITERGEVKIIDFGIARLMTRDPAAGISGDERPKLSALTPPYASPEMLEHRTPDARDDIYGLACIAHELVTGRHPFGRRVANEARDSGLKLERRQLLSPAQFRAIAHGLEFERDKRTASAEQFAEEFRGKSGVPVAAVGGGLAALLLAVLCAAYFLGHGRLSGWLQGQHAAPVAGPARGEVFRDCPTCPLMKALPPGKFIQGAAADDEAMPFERPQHPVVIGHGFGIGVYEVTVGEFREFADATGHRSMGCQTYDGAWSEQPAASWQNTGYQQTAMHPVACVSWRDAREYADWLSAKTGQRYRLPSESEWEYAARGGATGSRLWADSGAACANANVADESAAQRYPGWKVASCSDGFVYTAPVGSFKANAFGLFDMLGNVAEWVEDCWHDDYRGAPADGSAWLGEPCGERGVRGGSWFTAPARVSLSARNRFDDSYRSNSVGFRLVREMKQ
jgi:formylglycine-generating enzyme required for sulfatase activity/predicted Ser/Thr protein kinase